MMIRPRPYMPMKVRLDAALLALGLDPSNVEFDHCPSLGIRPYDPVTGLYSPDANDSRYIMPRAKADHARKTNGDHVPLSGDLSLIAKAKRLDEKHQAFRDRITAKTTGRRDGDREAKKRKRKWPKRSFPKRMEIVT